MTVRQIIKELEEFEPNMTVLLSFDEQDFDPEKPRKGTNEDGEEVVYL